MKTKTSSSFAGNFEVANLGYLDDNFSGIIGAQPPSRQRWKQEEKSNTIGDLWDKAQKLGQDAIDSVKAGIKTPTDTANPTTENTTTIKPPVATETTILGMNPITFSIVAVGTLAAAVFGIMYFTKTKS